MSAIASSLLRLHRCSTVVPSSSSSSSLIHRSLLSISNTLSTNDACNQQQQQQQRVITTEITLNPTKLPLVSPELVHQEALKRSLSPNVATGIPYMDLSVVRPVQPDFLKTPQTWVKNLKNEYTDLIDLEPYFFNCAPRKDILHMMVVWQLAKRRQGTHKTKYRLEVAYTKKKLYNQKGMGRARHADRAAPQFVGGGHALPVRPRDYSFKLNKKVRRLALRMALTTKFLQGKLIVMDEITVDIPKTKVVKQTLKLLGVGEGGVLFLDGHEVNPAFERASWNLSYVDYLPIQGINVYDLLRHDTVIMTRAALASLNAWYAPHIALNE